MLHPGKCFVFGASGFAMEVANYAEELGYKISDFVSPEGGERVCHTSGEFTAIPEEEFFQIDDAQINVFLGVGSPPLRYKIAIKLWQAGLNRHAPYTFPTLVHPTSYVAANAVLYEGCVIAPQCFISTRVTVEPFAVVNACSSVGHRTYIAQCSNIAPGCSISGDVDVGMQSYIGCGASVREGVQIASHVVVGSGAVVCKDLTLRGTYVGVPARLQTSPT